MLQADRVKNVENTIGSSFRDILTGNSVANEIRSGVGDDSISGGAGDYSLAAFATDSFRRGGGDTINDLFVRRVL